MGQDFERQQWDEFNKESEDRNEHFYYFTFGQSHTDKNGNPLKDYWVRVVASDPELARMIFIHYFAKRELPRPNAWSFQRRGDNFNPSFYPKGELVCFWVEESMV